MNHMPDYLFNTKGFLRASQSILKNKVKSDKKTIGLMIVLHDDVQVSKILSVCSQSLGW